MNPAGPAALGAVVATLRDWAAPDAEQDALRADYLAHLHRHPDALWRDGPPAHLTASCFVLDPTGERILLTLHRKGGFWVQLGGHLEPGDTSLADAALREGTEESGLSTLTLLPDGAPQPVGLNRHGLSTRFGRCREHLDVAFVAVAPADAVPVVSDESDDVAWWPVDDLPPTVVADLPDRLAAVRAAVRAAARAAARTAARGPARGPARGLSPTATGW